ncbi:MAG: hypothetical protein P1P85_00585 [Patescibacteria group bacterium]|nr:hypothetical protein [Patescibacteria group bacterium]
MKNITKKTIKLCSIFVSLFIIEIGYVKAQTPINIPNPISTSDFSKLVENFLLSTLGVAGSLALLMLIAGGIIYTTSSGDEQKVATAKKMITWTLLGLILILASYSIIVVLDQILT